MVVSGAVDKVGLFPEGSAINFVSGSCQNNQSFRDSE